MRSGSPSPRWRRRLALLVAMSLIIFAAWFLAWPYLITRRTEYTLSFDLSSDSPMVTIYLPFNSSPRLVSYTLTNLDSAAVRMPRLLNNGGPRLWTADEILDSIGGTQQPPDLLVLAINNFVRSHMVHVDDHLLAEGAPVDSLLQSVNFVGMGQCGEACIFVTQLAERAGLPALKVMLDRESPKGHVVAEVKWNGQWHLIDPDRDYIFPSDDFRRLLSFAEVRRQPELIARLPFDPAIAMRYVHAAEKILLTGQATPSRPAPLTPFLATRESDLAPGGQLMIDTKVQRSHKGCDVTLRATERPRDGEWILNLPYPLLRLEVSSRLPIPVQDPLHGRSRQLGAGLSPFVVDFGVADRPWLTPLVNRSLILANSNLAFQPIDLVAHMRCAPKSLPQLVEGANRLQVDSLSSKWKIRLTIRMSILEVH